MPEKLTSQHQEFSRPEAIYGPAAAAFYAQQQETENVKVAKQKEALESDEKPQELSLGELNPLIHPLDFGSKQNIESLKKVTLDLIESNRGIKPKKIGTEIAYSNDEKKAEMRFIARFETDTLNEEQILQLEALVKNRYGSMGIRTRKAADGKEINTERYTPPNRNQMSRSITAGWYMGPGQFPTEGLHPGLFVFQDLGEINEKNFADKDNRPSKYFVEVREGEMYQTDVVELITQISSILGNSKTLPHGDLLYDTYKRLMRLELKDFDPSQIHGMEKALEDIRRELINPLASPELSKGMGQAPHSALLAGVPGTGKTLVAQQLLYEETGLLIVPITPIDLFRELTVEPEKQKMFRRISDVARTTGKKVILHVDDIENITEEDEKTKSSLLNLMAGVTDNGFHMIASTNEPEKVGGSFIQPQRFGIFIHTRLPGEEARAEILSIHANSHTAKEQLFLFESDEERQIILDEVVKHTKDFTPRYIAEIATVAKSYLLERVAKNKGTHIGLKESDLGDERFTIEDWDKAVREVSRRYDKKKTVQRDKEIGEFVDHANESLGFKTKTMGERTIFSTDAREKIAALKNRKQE